MLLTVLKCTCGNYYHYPTHSYPQVIRHIHTFKSSDTFIPSSHPTHSYPQVIRHILLSLAVFRPNLRRQQWLLFLCDIFLVICSEIRNAKVRIWMRVLCIAHKLCSWGKVYVTHVLCWDENWEEGKKRIIQCVELLHVFCSINNTHSHTLSS